VITRNEIIISSFYCLCITSKNESKIIAKAELLKRIEIQVFAEQG